MARVTRRGGALPDGDGRLGTVSLWLFWTAAVSPKPAGRGSRFGATGWGAVPLNSRTSVMPTAEERALPADLADVVLAQLPAAFIVVDGRGDVLTASAATAELFGPPTSEDAYLLRRYPLRRREGECFTRPSARFSTSWHPGNL